MGSPMEVVRYKCTNCGLLYARWDAADACNCVERRAAEQSIADGRIGEASDEADHAEMVADLRPVTGDCNPTEIETEEPLVDPLACILNTVDRLEETFGHSRWFDIIRDAVAELGVNHVRPDISPEAKALTAGLDAVDRSMGWTR